MCLVSNKVFDAVFVLAYDAATVTAYVASFDVEFVTCLLLYLVKYLL